MGLKFNEWREAGKTSNKLIQLDSSIKNLRDSLNAYRQPSKVYTSSTNHPVDKAKVDTSSKK